MARFIPRQENKNRLATEIIYHAMQTLGARGENPLDVQRHVGRDPDNTEHRILTDFECFGVKYPRAKFTEDLQKIEFDDENVYVVHDFSEHDLQELGPDHLFGYHNLEGRQIYGMAAGGDWEHPVFFVLYFDGKTLRGYIPESGNVFNKDTRSAIGNDEDADDEYCVRVYNTSYDDIVESAFHFDWQALRVDIINRIQIR